MAEVRRLVIKGRPVIMVALSANEAQQVKNIIRDADDKRGLRGQSDDGLDQYNYGYVETARTIVEGIEAACTPSETGHDIIRVGTDTWRFRSDDG